MNPFYHCWLQLRANHPELREEMDEIEFAVSGVVARPRGRKPQEQSDDEEIGQIM
jgi:hypothetical protein